jgi:hypothetical protein
MMVRRPTWIRTIRSSDALVVPSWRKALLLIGQGSLVGLLLVLVAQTPRWLALWEALQYPARDVNGLSAAHDAGAATWREAAAPVWPQKVQKLPDELAAPALWRHWRQQHEGHGLRVLQWHRLETTAPTPAWPLAVHRARMEVQGDWTAWQRFWQVLSDSPGMWRLDQLQLQSAPAPEAPGRMRWQAHWSLALRPAAGAAVTAVNPVILDAITPAEPAAATPVAAAPGPSRPPDPATGWRVTDWPLSQLRWVGWWSVGDEQTALFVAEGRLFSVRAGEPVGTQGHRWAEADEQQLWLRARSVGADTPEPVRMTLGKP